VTLSKVSYPYTATSIPRQGKAQAKAGQRDYDSRTNLLARSLVVYAFGRFTVLFDAAVKPGTVLKGLLPDAIQTLR
jgi:hypothetical protein